MTTFLSIMGRHSKDVEYLFFFSTVKGKRITYNFIFLSHLVLVLAPIPEFDS